MLHLDAQLLLLGTLVGVSYGVLAAGIALVYRSTRIINLAHGDIGTFSSAVLVRLVINGHVPWLVAFPIALAVGAAVGAAVDAGVVRRLSGRPRVVLLVATIGVSELMVVGQLALPKVRTPGAPYPVATDSLVRIGSLSLSGADFLVLGVVPAAVLALTVFLNRTPTGLAVRAAADNPEAAELAGISPRRVSTIVWAMAGALSAATVVLVSPITGAVVGAPSISLGPGLLLRALVGALLGGLVSLPLAFLGGLLVGLGETLSLSAFPSHPGYVDVALLVTVLVLVLVRRWRLGEDRAAEESVSFADEARALPALVRDLPWARWSGRATWALLAALGALVPLLNPTAGALSTGARALLFAILGLSLVVLTGWSGQLSLGQVGLYGTGAMMTAALVQRGVPFPAAVAEATIAGVVLALVVGLPALVIRGLFLAATTLAFAVVCSSYVFQLHFFVGSDRVALLDPGRLLGADLRSTTAMYEVCLLGLIACCLLVARLRATGVGRSIIAVRSNDRRAASMTLSPAYARLVAFAVSGALAAFAGGLFAGLQRSVGYQSFPVLDSLTVVALVMIGGLRSPAGAVLGAAWVVGIPAVLGGSQLVTLLTSSIGLLILLLYVPGGLLSLVERARDGFLLAVARSRGLVDPASAPPPPAGGPSAPARRRTATTTKRRTTASKALATGPIVLSASGVCVRFGGRAALDGVDVEVRAGEVLGLIGANGSGKSTLLDVLAGASQPDSGVVLLSGRDVTAMPAHLRARLGLGRVFQDARLFEGMTVLECVQLSLEAHERTELVPSALGLPPSRQAERRKLERARQTLEQLGLSEFAGSPVRTLSTGTRRVVELACLVGQGASVLLLDEPTAGLAQREAEAFAPVLLRVREELGAAVVLVEHDIPLVVSIADRLQCLEAGRTLAEGDPHQVRSDPRVVASYLGTDERAIRRTGALTGS